MTDTIEPALSPEEWVRGQQVCAVAKADPLLLEWEMSLATGVRGFHTTHLNTVQAMALANAALPDDDPRKITRADVRNTEDAIGTIMMGVRVESLSIQGLWDFAAKLKALLPPE